MRPSLWFTFLLASLACFRLTRLITDDKITQPLRMFLVRNSPPKIKAKTKQGITCPLCVGFYFAAAITAYLLFACHAFDWRAALLWQSAIWGASVLWNQVFARIS